MKLIASKSTSFVKCNNLKCLVHLQLESHLLISSEVLPWPHEADSKKKKNLFQFQAHASQGKKFWNKGPMGLTLSDHCDSISTISSIPH